MANGNANRESSTEAFAETFPVTAESLKKKQQAPNQGMKRKGNFGS
ncbi:hypothetical protein CCACVL1_00416 [Corchorus capsularis]|uniref:Uncharacterized protein n=1 Tax=Corchorus capsularis TaxID=210143 RepID=A0A1R3KWV6_COCAP|nr:hypothetical protein CCACVL1_00416 [Corchorus capsularis]